MKLLKLLKNQLHLSCLTIVVLLLKKLLNLEEHLEQMVLNIKFGRIL